MVMFFNSLFKQVMRFSRFFLLKRKQASSAYNTVNSSSDVKNIVDEDDKEKRA